MRSLDTLEPRVYLIGRQTKQFACGYNRGSPGHCVVFGHLIKIRTQIVVINDLMNGCRWGRRPKYYRELTSSWNVESSELIRRGVDDRFVQFREFSGERYWSFAKQSGYVRNR